MFWQLPLSIHIYIYKKPFMKKLWNCLQSVIEWKHTGTGGHNPLGVEEKHFPKSFKDMKKHLQILEEIVMKFFLNFIFTLES